MREGNWSSARLRAGANMLRGMGRRSSNSTNILYLAMLEVD